MQFVGRYQIEDRIGEGAMADVYRAYDPSIDRVLAIKILKAELRSNAEIVRRFLREAKAAGALSHPNIVTVYDVGEADNYPYIAMELLDGAPLDEHVRAHGPMPVAALVEIGEQLARALDYAHRAGIIHRDIKPSNIMLCDGGRSAKILDFGIARVGEADQVRAELNLLRTQVGQVLGTPRYMSPEQALGLEIDHRSDLFSLGVVLYEMATGRMAFDGTSLATVALQITQHKPEPLVRAAPGCPKGLQYLIEKLLAKQPDKRFASGADVADALQRERAALESARPGRRLSLQWRLSLAMGAAMSVALLLSILVVVDRQYRSMEQMALTSGAAVSNFVANNVGLRAAENAGLPAAQQDWAPVQAFVDSAAGDTTIQQILVVDAQGIVHGSSDPARIGTRFVAADEPLLSESADERISETAAGDFRIRRTIRYAGQPFGSVELVVSSASFKAAAAHAAWLLLVLGIVLLLAVLAVGYATARNIARPIRQLNAALNDAAAGNRFRISHTRRDEFGELFDSYNRLAEAMDEAAPSPESAPASLEATRIGATILPAPGTSGFGRRVA